MTLPRQYPTDLGASSTNGDSVVLEGDFEPSPLYVPKTRDIPHSLNVNPFRRTPAGMGLPKRDPDGAEMCGAPALRGYSDPNELLIMGLKKAPMSCGRETCPNDYPHWSRTTTFAMAVVLEARCHMEGTRPAHVTYGPKNTLAQTWTDNQRYQRHKRRGARHMRKVGVTGWIDVLHDYRIMGSRWAEIKASGWNGRKWDAVRENVLDLGEGPEWWRHYVIPGLHSHAFTVESWLKEHNCKDFFLRKIRYLPTIEDTVKAIRYALSHSTTLEGHPDHAFSKAGTLHGWDPDTDPDMDPSALLAIRREVAGRVGMVWNDEEKRLEYPPKPAVLGELVPPQFKNIGKLHQDMLDRVWTSTLSKTQWDFMEMIYLCMKKEINKCRPWLPFVDWENDVPPDMTVWGDVVEPPPWADLLPAQEEEAAAKGVEEEEVPCPLKDLLTPGDLAPSNNAITLHRHPKYLGGMDRTGGN